MLLDPGRHLVEKNGRPVHLTPKQFELLHYLMMHAGRPIPHAKLLRSVWGPEYGNELEYLRTFIRQIRLKIEDDPANPQYLVTDSHIGYRFSENVEIPLPRALASRDCSAEPAYTVCCRSRSVADQRSRC